MFLYINALLSINWSGKQDDRLNRPMEIKAGDRLNSYTHAAIVKTLFLF